MISNTTHKAIVRGTNVLIATPNVLAHSEAADSFNECISKGEEDQILAMLDEMSAEQDAEIEAMKAKNNELKRLKKI